jgi:pyruvate/2-oxoglutarate dehydrogenase complex dihydrolipoamide acyltransferase (E2) component
MSDTVPAQLAPAAEEAARNAAAAEAAAQAEREADRAAMEAQMAAADGKCFLSWIGFGVGRNV